MTPAWSTIAALSVLLSFGAAAPAAADEALLGGWKTENGTVVVFAPCADAFCATVKTGSFAGQQIGRMQGSAPRYTGTVTDPRSGKTYDGSATVNGTKLALQGCVAKVFCRTQNWTR